MSEAQDEVVEALRKWAGQELAQPMPQVPRTEWPVRSPGFWEDLAMAHVSRVVWLLEAAGESTVWDNVVRHLEGMEDAKRRVRLYLAAGQRAEHLVGLQIVEDYFEREYMALREGARRTIVITAMRVMKRHVS